MAIIHSVSTTLGVANLQGFTVWFFAMREGSCGNSGFVRFLREHPKLAKMGGCVYRCETGCIIDIVAISIIISMHDIQ